ncbi:MAG: PASTA domain-containing protein, partial [Candidatus Rokuibacteriota bacterium]
DEPKNEKWGSEAAAPIFSAIGAEVLRHLDVPPRDAAPLSIVTGPAEASPGRVRLASVAAAEPPLEARVMPDLHGRTLRQALATLAPLDVTVELAGKGRVVTEHAPLPGEALDEPAQVRLTLAGAAAR